MQKLLYLTSTMMLTGAVGVILALASCRRTSVIQTTEEKLTGKWIIKAAIGNYTTNGVNRKDTTKFTSADYFDFKADGTLSIVETNVPYNGNWKVTNNKLYITNTHYLDYANGFDLPVLNQTDLQLYYTESNSFSSLEQKLNLSK